MKKALHVAIEENKLKDLQLRESIKKIGELNVQKVNRRIKRSKQRFDDVSTKQDEVIVDLSCELLGEHEEIKGKDDNNETLKSNLDRSLKEKLSAQKMKWYYKNKRGNMNNSEIESYSRLDVLSSKIRELENKKMEIKEKLVFFLKSEDICLFENGKYVDTV